MYDQTVTAFATAGFRNGRGIVGMIESAVELGITTLHRNTAQSRKY